MGRPSTTPSPNRRQSTKLVPALKNLPGINHNQRIALTRTLTTAARLNALRPSTTPAKSTKVKGEAAKKKPKPLEIEYVGLGPVERHASNNLLAYKAMELQPSKEGHLSARGVHHRSQEYFINLGQQCTFQLRHNNKGPKKTLGDANLYFQRGLAHAVLGNREKAIQDYSICIRVFVANRQNCAAAYFNRALLHHSDNNIDAALQDITLAIAQDSSKQQFYDYRSMLLRLKNKYIEVSASDLRRTSWLDHPTSLLSLVAWLFCS